MMQRISTIILTYCFALLTAHGQEYRWQFIEYPKVNYAISNILQSGQNVWAISEAEGASIWNDERRSWKECARFTFANYARAYCSGDDGSIYVLLNNDEKVIRVDGSSVQEIRELETRRQYQTMLYMGEGKIIQVGTTYDGTLVKGSVFDADSDQEIETLTFVNVESVRLASLPACASHIMTVVDRISSTESDTSSYVYDAVDRSWREMTNYLDAVSTVDQNGKVYSVRYADSACLARQSCIATDVIYQQPRAMNRLLSRSNGHLVGWVQSASDTALPMLWTSSDNGVTFTPIEEARSIRGYITGVAEVGDSILMFSVAANVYRCGTTLEQVNPPQAPTTQPRTELTHLSDNYMAVGRDNFRYLDILYDHETGLWSSLTNNTGKELLTAKIIRLDDCIVSSDVESCYRTELGSTDALVIRDEDGGLTSGELLAAYQDTEGRICAFVSRRWIRTDTAGGSASAMTTNWPKNVANRYLAPTTVVKVHEAGQTTLIAGTYSEWTLITSDSLVIPYPLYGVLTSTDNGVTWSMSNSGLGKDLFCYDMMVHGNVVYAFMSYATGLNRTRAWLYGSTDAGKTWIAGSALPPEFINPMELSVDDNGTLYCAGGGLVKSHDMGDSWESINGPVDVPFKPYDCQATEYGLYVVTELGLYRTDIISSVSEPEGNHEGVPYWNGSSIVLPSTTDLTVSTIELYDTYGRPIEISIRGVEIMPSTALASGLYILTIDGRAFKLFHTH